MPSSTSLLPILSLAALCGCATELSEHTSASCHDVDQRSLLENDPAVVTDARFGLQRVLEQIRATTPRTPSLVVPTAREMFTQLFDAFGTCSGRGVDPRRYGLACRDAERSLGAQDPFTNAPDALHFQPVALINRFDLAGQTSSTCGESRIVYWQDRGPTAGTAGFIVELATAPVIVRGRRTCDPIVKFWTDLSQDDDPASRSAKLEQYFFEGLPGMAHPPVSALGAGWGGAGQLRSNNFVGAVQWNLREAKWQKVCANGTCSARFTIVDTKGSPSDRLFSGTHEMATEFQAWFLDRAVPRLAAATEAHELSLGNPAAYNAYESISQPKAGDPTGVTYAATASTALRDRVSSRLVELGSSLTADDIFKRATAVTCAGCHRVARGADLGGGMTFPMFGGFTHVGRGGALSALMTDDVLPRRQAMLQAMICAPPRASTDATAPADTRTISGRPIGDHP